MKTVSFNGGAPHLAVGPNFCTGQLPNTLTFIKFIQFSLELQDGGGAGTSHLQGRNKEIHLIRADECIFTLYARLIIINAIQFTYLIKEDKLIICQRISSYLKGILPQFGKKN